MHSFLIKAMKSLKREDNSFVDSEYVSMIIKRLDGMKCRDRLVARLMSFAWTYKYYWEKHALFFTGARNILGQNVPSDYNG